MDLETTTTPAGSLDTPLLVVPIVEGGTSDLEDLDRRVGGALRSAIDAGDFTGKSKDQLLAHGRESSGPRRFLFLGVGPADDLTPEDFRIMAGKAAQAAEKARVDTVAIDLSQLEALDPGDVASATAEGLTLASWRYGELQRVNDDDAPPLVGAVLVIANESGADSGAARGHALGEGANFARTLQARPGNVATPTHLADQASEMAKEVGLTCHVMGPDDLQRERMGALMSVAQGSDQEPRLIVLKSERGKSGEPPVVLVGKGLTFDAGGISLKPAKGMEEMKYDMSGGAAVLGAMKAIAAMDLAINVVALVPSSENLINGSATKPGDVITARSGTTIEVINTDAEGRLILADALDYATEMQPAAIVDCATLTGACVIALGHHRSGLMGNDESLLEEVQTAGDRSGEPCWILPLDPPYHKQLESPFADLKNVGGRPGGSITAGCFLSNFVGDAPWAHLDVAGTAYGDIKKSYLKEGPVGNPSRLLVEWVRSRVAS